MTPEPVLSVSHISKSFHFKQVLKNITFSLSSGTGNVLIGTNGAGKTTLLKVLAGIMRPDEGTGSLVSQVMFKEACKYRKHLIFWGHQALLYPAFTGMENIKFFLSIRGEHQSDSRILEELEKYGLHHQLHDPVRIYSAGMLQRLAMIRLSLADWKVALLDEPTSALDVDGVRQLNRLITEWKGSGKTILYSTHDIHWAADHADRALCIIKGVIGKDIPSPTVQQINSALEGKA